MQDDKDGSGFDFVTKDQQEIKIIRYYPLFCLFSYRYCWRPCLPC